MLHYEQCLTVSPLFVISCQKCDVSKHKVLVASMCPQSLPFFAVKFGLDITEAAHKVCAFLKSLGEQVGFIYRCLLPPPTHRYLSWKLDIFPHSWLSLCRRLCFSSLWFSPAGVQYVFDTTLAAGFSILESQKEFIQRYRRRHHDSHALPMFTSSCPGKTTFLLTPSLPPHSPLPLHFFIPHLSDRFSSPLKYYVHSK